MGLKRRITVTLESAAALALNFLNAVKLFYYGETEKVRSGFI